MTVGLWADLGRRLRDAPEGLAVVLFTPSPASVWHALGELGLELVDQDLQWHHLGLHGLSVARSFRPGRLLFVVGFEAVDAEGRAEVYAHLNRARDQLSQWSTRLVLFVPSVDEDMFADHAIDLLALRGPVRRLGEVEGGPSTLTPPAWSTVRDVAARRAVACLPAGVPEPILRLVRAIRWGAILFAEGEGRRVETSMEVSLASPTGSVPEFVGNPSILEGGDGRRPVRVIAGPREHAVGGPSSEEALASWLVVLRLAASRPEPVRWEPRNLVEPGRLLPPEGRRRAITLVVGGLSRPVEHLPFSYAAEDMTGELARLRAEALDTYVPREDLLEPLSVAADVLVVGHALFVEATLEAAGIPWSYELRRGATRVHRLWGNPRTDAGLRADPWPYASGREPGWARTALARPTAWYEVDGWGPAFCSLFLREKRGAPQLVIGAFPPAWLRTAGVEVDWTSRAIAAWAEDLAAKPAPAGAEPPVRGLPNDPALARVVARPLVRWHGGEEPLLDVLARERRLWVEGAPGCGKSLFATLLPFGAASRGDPKWSAWALDLPAGVQTVRLRAAEAPGRPPPSDTLLVLDDAHALRPSDRARLRSWFEASPEDAGWVLVLDRPALDETGPVATWVPPDDPTPWFRWRCAGTPAAAMLEVAGLAHVEPAWRTIGIADVFAAEFGNGDDPTGPEFVYRAARASMAAAWPLLHVSQLGDIQRSLERDPVAVPEAARRHLPGGLRRAADGRLDWVRATDAILARALAIPDRAALPEGDTPEPLDALVRVIAVVEAADAEVLEADVLEAWLAEARGRPGFAGAYLTQLFRAFTLDLDDVPRLLALEEPVLLPAVAEVRSTHGYLGTWGIGPWSDPRPDEGPARNVRLSEFTMDLAPVTVARFGAFLRAGGYAREELWHPEGWAWRRREGIVGPALTGEPAHPITGVSWYEADAFARWSGGGLPTEAQWESAAKLGGRGLWSGRIEPVMRGRGAPYDMGGNVLEWCRDGYDPAFPAFAPAWDPVGPERPERSLRGAPYWVRDLADRHPWRRWHLPPTTRREDVGFRVAYRG